MSPTKGEDFVFGALMGAGAALVAIMCWFFMMDMITYMEFSEWVNSHPMPDRVFWITVIGIGIPLVVGLIVGIGFVISEHRND